MGVQRTFDQIRIENPDLDPTENPVAFAPNTAINCKLVFEPMKAQGHVRITARSDEYELLWGVTASRSMLSRHPFEVAVYERLVELAQPHLPPSSAAVSEKVCPVVRVKVEQLRRCLDAIEASVTPKKVSEKTEQRASRVLPNLNDALRLLTAWVNEE